MAFMINEKSVFESYSKLSDEQKARFFPGKIAQAKKIIGSLCYMLGSEVNYDQLLELYITATSRLMMGIESDRISATIKVRFSDIVPDYIATTVVDCIMRIAHNFAYIEKENTPEMQSFLRFFDTKNEDAYKRNENRFEDATLCPGFGVDPSNPIYAHSSAGSYFYLNGLYTSDYIPLTWNRVESLTVESSPDLIDKYELLLPNGEIYKIVYVNMYSRNASIYCPAGLQSDELQDLPLLAVNQAREMQPESEEDEFLAFLQNYSKSSDQTEPVESATEEKQPGTRKEKNDEARIAQLTADEVLSETSVPVLQGNIPVLHSKSAILKKTDGSVYAICTFLPVLDTSIRAMQVDLNCYNVWNEQIASVDHFQYIDLKTQRDTAFGSDIAIPIPDPSTRNIELFVRRVMLIDGKMIQREEENVVLPAWEPLESYFTDKELLEEYRRQTYKNSLYTPVKVGAYWRCTCGALNRCEEASCNRCKDSSEKLFSWLDKDRLQSSLDERKRLQREKEERERKAREEAQQKAEEQARIEAARKAEEARVRAEKKKKQNKLIAICSVVVAAIALAVYLIGWHAIPAFQYRKADNLLASGDREAAYTTFSNLGRYKDCSDRAAAIHYEDAASALSAGNYDEAYALFASLGVYKDSVIQAKESLYQKAYILMESSSYEEAAEIFESLGNYRDSEASSIQCRNEKSYIDATALFEEGRYQEAGEQFEISKDYRDSSFMMMKAFYLYAKELIEDGKLHEAYEILSSKVNVGTDCYEDSVDLANTVEYQYASDCFAAGSYAEAAQSFANLNDYEDSQTRSLESKYQYGLQLIGDGKFDEAEKLFSELGDYKDSATQINESIYLHGLSLLAAENYDEAITVLGRLTNYRDSNTQYNEARYQKALQLLRDEQYQKAEKLFEELGYYSDSQERLKEAKYQRAMSLVKDKKYTQAVPIFEELGYYSDSVDQRKAAMWSYVLAHKNDTDKTTYVYLSELKNYGYEKSESYYKELYSWRAQIVINNSETDSSTKMNSLTTYDTIYCHFSIQGGPPGEVVALQAIGFWPNGGSTPINWNGTNEWRRGYSGTVYFWYENPDYGSKGTFTLKLYIGGVVIGEQTVRLK